MGASKPYVLTTDAKIAVVKPLGPLPNVSADFKVVVSIPQILLENTVGGEMRVGNAEVIWCSLAGRDEKETLGPWVRFRVLRFSC